jgi:crotonobetaine/carnitine-CoA ligase
MFTSGTSGPSKGVEMPHAHCVLFAIGTIENYQLSSTDRFYICLPLFHANGLFMQLLACLKAGCTAIVREKFSASNWLPDIRRFAATHTNTLGAVAAFITAQPATSQDTDHTLKVIGAAPLPASVEASFRNRFGVASVVPLYGMTEVNIPLYGHLNESAPGTCGRVYEKYFQVEIRHPDTDEPVADGDTGEIMVRPKQPWGFMSGYAGMPDKTIEAWRNFWFHTGDAGYRNSAGQFVFVDRIKDCIRRRGENISSYEVEQAFLAIDGVAEAAAYAVAAEGGEGMEDEVMVALQLNTAADKTTLLDWRATAATNLARFALPRYLRVMPELPKTPTGKIRKVVLREQRVTQETIDTQKVS